MCILPHTHNRDQIDTSGTNVLDLFVNIYNLEVIPLIIKNKYYFEIKWNIKLTNLINSKTEITYRSNNSIYKTIQTKHYLK